MRYRAHSAMDGWKEFVRNGEVAGTTGEGKKLEAIEIELADIPNLGISYSTHLADIGWTAPVVSNQVTGTVGEDRAIEAFQAQLYGDEAQNYDIIYRLHIQDYGWLNWAQNGEISGSTGGGKQAEALQMFLCKKGSLPLKAMNEQAYLELTPVVAIPEPVEAQEEALPSNARESVINIAQSFIGYTEDANGNTIFGNEFGMPDAEWCHLFVTYCYNHAGFGNRIPQVAYCPYGVDWFLGHDTYYFYSKYQYEPRTGDVIYFDWNYNDSPNHVGLVLDYDGETVTTIEGNTGEPEQVMVKYWNAGSDYIMGYGVSLD